MIDALIRDLGGMDIYLVDQIQRGRIQPGMHLFDAGCGSGRNILPFLRAGFEVGGADTNPDAVEAIRRAAAPWMGERAEERFRVEPIESLSEGDESADLVICNAVLHFARDDDHFTAMMDGVWRILRGGGVLFCRLASSVGLEGQAVHRAGKRFLLPDGTERYLVDVDDLIGQTARLAARLLDPIKTSVVHGQRSMTTWVLQKP